MATWKANVDKPIDDVVKKCQYCKMRSDKLNRWYHCRLRRQIFYYLNPCFTNDECCCPLARRSVKKIYR